MEIFERNANVFNQITSNQVETFMPKTQSNYEINVLQIRKQIVQHGFLILSQHHFFYLFCYKVLVTQQKKIANVFI